MMFFYQLGDFEVSHANFQGCTLPEKGTLSFREGSIIFSSRFWGFGHCWFSSK